jgi:No apical meristem (NAM) protein
VPLALGFRFQHTNEELVIYYLKRKNLNRPLRCRPPLHNLCAAISPDYLCSYLCFLIELHFLTYIFVYGIDLHSVTIFLSFD